MTRSYKHLQLILFCFLVQENFNYDYLTLDTDFHLKVLNNSNFDCNFTWKGVNNYEKAKLGYGAIFTYQIALLLFDLVKVQDQDVH